MARPQPYKTPADPIRRDRARPGIQQGAVAQLGERVVRNDEVSGSIPLSSTTRLFI